MKFPITRESLQAFDSARDYQEEQEEENQRILREILNQFCGDFKQKMSENSKEKKFIWKKLDRVRQPTYNTYNRTTKIDYLSQFIEKLKETFIGCDIIIDPLKTYLIIDWS